MPGKKIVFLDEMPWMDSRQSNFLSALEGFWNGWASGRDDMLLIACGSATSWITRKLFRNRAGLHNRVTRRVFLEPFSLKECRDFFLSKGFDYTRKHIAESYLTFGGIPYYLDLFSPELSPTQNTNALCFEANGALADEYQSLYASLFDQPQRYTAVVEALADKAKGLNRQEIVEAAGLSNGGTLTKMLGDLEQCGFIRRYREYGKKNKDAIFQLIDPYTLFYLKKAKGHVAVDEDYWTGSLQSGSRNAWSGYAFEMLCLWHLPQIKARLGISGVSTEVYAWRSKASQPGVQIDLVIERKDGIINLCEIKNTAATLEISEGFAQELNAKKAAFRNETGTKKALHTTLISASPLPHASFRHDIQATITLEDLFT
jgi:hypothetical protein